MQHKKIAIIGAGNMGQCLVGGLINHGHSSEQLIVSDPHAEKITFMQQHFAVHVTASNEAAITNAHTVIFAIKPQKFVAVAKTLAAIVVKTRPLIISIAAGIRTELIATCIGKDCAIVRAMPNTAALIGMSATGLFANEWVTTAQKNQAEAILKAVGKVTWVAKETDLDIITALSGSGPAYFFLIMEALELAAQDLGLDKEASELLTRQTALGAAQMALNASENLATLRSQVTSKGGTTEQGLAVLEKHHLADILKAALLAAKKRSEELASFS